MDIKIMSDDNVKEAMEMDTDTFIQYLFDHRAIAQARSDIDIVADIIKSLNCDIDCRIKRPGS